MAKNKISRYYLLFIKLSDHKNYSIILIIKPNSHRFAYLAGSHMYLQQRFSSPPN